MRILVVEDDVISKMKLVALFALYGDCVEVEDGMSALEAFREAHEAGNPFTVVSMDVELPGMNGHEIVQRIREYEETQGIVERCRVMMVTVDEDIGNIVDSFEFGADWYIVKPIDPEKIQEALHGLGVAGV